MKKRNIFKQILLAAAVSSFAAPCLLTDTITFAEETGIKGGRIFPDVETDIIQTGYKLSRTQKNGWIYEAGNWYYYDSDSFYAGWHYMTDKEGESVPHWSYFGNDGRLFTGWHYMSEKEGETTPHWSYFGDNGWLTTGWFKESEGIEGLRYFDDSGWLAGGSGYKSYWLKIGRVFYRFDDTGRINGARMYLVNTYDQRSYYFLGGCGPTAAFHAAHATESLSDYPNISYGYRKFIWDFYGMPYNSNDKYSKGVYTNGTSIPQLADHLTSLGVEVETSLYRQYSTDEIQEALVHGQAVVPLINHWHYEPSGSFWAQHYVAVTGWKTEGESLQFYTVDSYSNQNTGWADVDKNGMKSSNDGYNTYTGYIDEIGAAATPRNGIGYAMKIGTYIDLH